MFHQNDRADSVPEYGSIGIAGALPFTPAGIGVFEIALDRLYQVVPIADTSNVSGIIVALAFRLVTIMVAMIGVVFYWSSRSEVRAIIEEGEAEQQEEKARAGSSPNSTA